MKTFTRKVSRNVPAYQFGTATVQAKTQKEADQLIEAMEASFSWEEPEVPVFGDGEAGDIEIID